MNEPTDSSAIFAPIWRRKWLILAVGVVAALVSYVYYKHERPTYEASTQVYLGASTEEQASASKGSSKGHGVALGGQAAIVTSIVAEEVRQRLRNEHKGALIRGAKVRAKLPEKSEFLAITTEAHSASGAAFLANTIAQAYIKRQRTKRENGIEKAIALTRRQLLRIEEATAVKEASKPAGKGASGSSGSTSAKGSSSVSASSVLQAATLSSKINELESSLGAATALQVKPARAQGALLLSPKPQKNAIFGFVLGLVLAAVAVYAFSRLDRRLRSLARIEAVLRAPLLAALPKVSRPIVRSEGPPRPSNLLVEPLRTLHTTLHPPDVSNGSSSEQGARVILFVSPDPGDGKSTLVADLALAQRASGARVVVVEANFRRPIQERLLSLDGNGSLAQVLAGRIDVDEALQRVLPAHAEGALAGEGGAGVLIATETNVGSLFVLTGDQSVANPPALLAQEGTSELLRSLAASFDYVLIDGPSPLEVSDVIPLLGVVDGVVIVARIGHAREASAQRLRQLLERPACAPVLGFVANCAARGELKRYGYSSFNGRRPASGAP